MEWFVGVGAVVLVAVVIVGLFHGPSHRRVPAPPTPTQPPPVLEVQSPVEPPASPPAYVLPPPRPRRRVGRRPARRPGGRRS